MASSISNSDAELKVVWAQAGKLSLSAPVSFEDANGFDEALEVVGSDPNVLIGAVEAPRRDTNDGAEVPRTWRHWRFHLVDRNLQLAFAIREDHGHCLVNGGVEPPRGEAERSARTTCYTPMVANPSLACYQARLSRAARQARQ